MQPSSHNCYISRLILITWSCCNHPPISLLPPNWPSLVWPPLVWFPAVLSCGFLFTSVVNSLVTQAARRAPANIRHLAPFSQMNASWECGLCYSCCLPGPELGQLVLLIGLLWWSPLLSALQNIHELQHSAPPWRMPLPADDACDRAASSPVHVLHYRAWTNLSRAQTSGGTVVANEGLIGFTSDQIPWAPSRWDLQLGVARY